MVSTSKWSTFEFHLMQIVSYFCPQRNAMKGFQFLWNEPIKPGNQLINLGTYSYFERFIVSKGISYRWLEIFIMKGLAAGTTFFYEFSNAALHNLRFKPSTAMYHMLLGEDRINLKALKNQKTPVAPSFDEKSTTINRL